MFCKKCGKELQEGAKFCAGCGAEVTAGPIEEPVVEPAVEPVEPVVEPAVEPVEPVVEPAAEPVAEPVAGSILSKLGKKKGLLIGIAAAVVVVLVALILLLSGVFTPAKAKVGAALLKTVDAYTEAYEKAGLPDTTELWESQKVNQNLALTITDVGNTAPTYMKALEGLGVRAEFDANIPGKKVSASAAAYYGATDLIGGQFAVDNNKVYIGSTELLGEGVYYGADTTTLGADLVNVGADKDAEDLSFNLFELIQIAQDGVKVSDETQKNLDKAKDALLDAIVVEKAEKKSVKVNGTALECAAYPVMIPQNALEDYLDVAMDAASDTDYEKLMLDLLLAIGMPEKEAEDAVDEMDFSGDSLKDVQDMLEEVLDVLEDIELTVYVKGGYVMAVEYENEIEGIDMLIGLYLGGGKNYVDDISLVFEGDDGIDEISLELVSTGNHTASGGTFTDETTLEVKEGKSVVFGMVSEISYAPKAKENNFSWTLEVEDIMDLEAEGQLTSSGSKMSLALEEVSLKVEGTKVGAVELLYEVESYSSSVNVKKPVMLSTLDEDSIQDLGEDIVKNAEDWAEGVMELLEDELPEGMLEDLMWMLM